MKSITIIALGATGDGISGGDRIFIEFARRWSKIIPIKIILSEEGVAMCRRQDLKESKNLKFEVINFEKWNNFLLNYIAKIIWSIRWAIRINTVNLDTVFSASEFWMDSCPGVLLKIRTKKVNWLAAWYQTAPNPWLGFSYSQKTKRYRLRAFIYWLSQQPIKIFIKWKADFVLVNNPDEKKVFPKLNQKNRTIVVLGGVDTKKITNYKLNFSKIKLSKKYDAVFQGRFHPQKGVEEMVKIWGSVVKKKPNAKLLMIGDGPLMQKVEFQVRNNKLQKNIILKGYLFDGHEKYQIFAESKFVVHPSLFDSGGMASAEAMAFGLPSVGFDLKSYKTYHPFGMIKVPIGNLSKFADVCLYLIDYPVIRQKIGRQAMDFILKNRSWDKIANQTYQSIFANK